MICNVRTDLATTDRRVPLIRKHTRRAAKAAFAIAFGVAIILGGAASATAGSTAPQATPIIVGTKNFGEAFVLGQLYKQASSVTAARA